LRSAAIAFTVSIAIAIAVVVAAGRAAGGIRERFADALREVF
jgi:hypothetical protein